MNKTRRRKKSTPGEPYSRKAREEERQSVINSKSKRERIERLIEKHCGDAERLTKAAEEAARDRKDYSEAGKLLREASTFLHLAGAEQRKLPPDAL